MKNSLLMLTLLMTLSAVSAVNAQIYKWKDKNGYTKYSDTPPITNVKIETLNGKKAAKPSSQALVPVDADKPATTTNVAGKEVPPTQDNEDQAAQKRRNEAELDKKAKQEIEAQEKVKAENCKSAKSNLESFVQGGRIFKMNEKGEREYLDDAGLKKGADKSRAEVAKYCN